MLHTIKPVPDAFSPWRIIQVPVASEPGSCCDWGSNWFRSHPHIAGGGVERKTSLQDQPDHCWSPSQQLSCLFSVGLVFLLLLVPRLSQALCCSLFFLTFTSSRYLLSSRIPFCPVVPLYLGMTDSTNLAF